MKKDKVRLLTWVLALLPAVLVAVFYGRLPDRVPTNWGLDGTVTYGGKMTLWFLALLPPALAVLLTALPKIDPKKRNYERFQGYYDGFCAVLMLFLLAMVAVTLTESLRPGTLSVSRAVTMGIGVLFAFLGNILPKVKSNFFMGVKTPWTLSDPDVWNRSNRLAGLLFFLVGILLVPCALLLPELGMFIVMMAGVAVAAAVPCVCSYIWYREKCREPVDKDRDE